MKKRDQINTDFWNSGLSLIVILFLITLISCGGKNPVDNNDINNQKVVIPLPADNPLNIFIKNVGTTPAPNWVKPGTRIVFFSGSAWMYSPGAPPSNQLSDSGSGYTVVDVVSISKDLVVLNFRYFVKADYNSPPKYTGSGSYTGPPSVGFNLYVHPQILRTLLTLNSAEIKSVRMNYQLNGVTYQAIRVQYETATDYLAYTFDEVSGVLLVMTMREQKKREAQTQFVSKRQMNLPWSNSAVPAWVNTVNQIRYQGTETITQPGSYPFSQSVSATAQVQKRGNNWLEYLYSYSSQSSSMHTKLVSGSAQIGGLWISPDVLANLRQGQEIDMDAAVNVQTSVAFVGALNNNKKVVVVRELSAQQQMDYAYDFNTGVLYRVTITDLIAPLTGTMKVTDVILINQN